MKHEERLDRMLESGVISQEQYNSLQVSLTHSEELHKEELRSKRIPLWVGVAVAIINLLIAIALIDFGGDVPQVQQTAQAVEDVRQTLNTGGVGAMDSKLSSIFSIALFSSFILLPLLLFTYLHNSLVSEEEEVFTAWAQVESNYQRRSDLIPNMVETVSKALKHEAEVLGNIAEERSNNIDETVSALVSAQKEGAELLKEVGGKAPEDDAQLAMLHAAQGNIGSLMHKMVATVENYPNLKGNDNIMALQAQLEGTENRINIARMRFNEVAGQFNASMRRMPTSLIASLGNFKRKAYFQADSGSEKPTQVKFD